MQTLRAIRAVWLVTVLAGCYALAMGCGGGALDDGGGECGPREDSIGGWRSADGTELRMGAGRDVRAAGRAGSCAAGAIRCPIRCCV